MSFCSHHHLLDENECRHRIGLVAETLFGLQAKFKIDEEARKLADSIMMQDDSYSAQPFHLDSTKFAAVLAQLRAITAKVAESLGTVMRWQVERRTHSLAQVSE